ncbi:DNA (cytosine-5-)-methyltransferase [Brucella anthropi]|uniref:DNA (cytosine-5-)-methyltransferase n=1 Tax=Brucella anthropi TaxID=529 RepID=A0A6I0DPA6_BRUAN|nr:DNA (cytosine-5-)-methyltransferase [Brucella anthropi]KAB2798957.1 DNA (cytosine-5-)-methyltransferase [Brucella anthropi]
MKKLRVLDLFSGVGGFSLGLERSGGFETVAFCEIDQFATDVLSAHWPRVRIYDDVTKLTAERIYRDNIGPVNVICGGFPCQDASVANVEGMGTAGDRTGLFSEIIRLAREIGPDLRCIIMENVPNLLNRGFGDILSALAEIGFDAEWGCISAAEVGAPHRRERLWIVAYPERKGREGSQSLRGTLSRAEASLTQHGNKAFGSWGSLVASQSVLRGVDGLSVAMERRRLHQIGNAVTPEIPELIGRSIIDGLERSNIIGEAA